MLVRKPQLERVQKGLREREGLPHTLGRGGAGSSEQDLLILLTPAGISTPSPENCTDQGVKNPGPSFSYLQVWDHSVRREF